MNIKFWIPFTTHHLHFKIFLRREETQSFVDLLESVAYSVTHSNEDLNLESFGWILTTKGVSKRLISVLGMYLNFPRSIVSDYIL